MQQGVIVLTVPEPSVAFPIARLESSRLAGFSVSCWSEGSILASTRAGPWHDPLLFAEADTDYVGNSVNGCVTVMFVVPKLPVAVSTPFW